MTGPGFQLFPPPPRAPRQTSPNRRPSPAIKQPTPEPTAVRMDSATDFHELVIQVNSVPVSPSSTIAPLPTVATPMRAHVANSHAARTPPQANMSTFGSPQQQTPSSNLMMQEDDYRPRDPRAPSPCVSVREDQRFGSPEVNRAASPAFSTCETLVRANSTATRVRSMSPQQEVSMRSMFPVYDPTVPLGNQTYKPPMSSPTHVARTQISRSPYSTDSYIPHSNVRASSSTAPPAPKPFFTPSHLLDNLWLATNGQEEPAVQLYTLRMHRATAANPTITFGTTPSLPFYSLAQANLAEGNDVPSIMNEVLIQRHHPTQPRVLPISHMDLIAPPSLDTGVFNPQQQEATTLITSIYPKLAALQALDAAANSPAASRIALADPGAQSPAAQRLAEDVLAGAAQRECCALTWTRDDPQQQANPWAQHIPSEGSYQLHHPTLGNFPIKVEGDCSVINTPSTRPVTAIYGHNAPMTPQSARKPASIAILNPFVLSPTTPRTNAFSPLPPPPRFDGMNRPVSLTPSVMSIGQLPTTTDATADDAVLGRLDFTNDALTLNLGALSRFGNPFLVDVITSTILAVAIAEATRGRKNRKASQESFEPPPPSFLLTHQKEDTAKAFKESFVEGFQGFGGKTKAPAGLKKFASSMKSSRKSSRDFDKDIELGEWYGQDKTTKAKETKAEQKARKKQEDQDKLPLVTRTIVNVLTFAFKSVVFVIKIAIKIVAGVVVMITRNFGKL
ncbi:hypothetical protein HBI70_053570 [Parastagonospora nodorum]|nr:hypothetical protein HBH49_057280 [Parastagonospora nodorum]KAH5002711.1 hypothetical protein HBI74_242300 [Parastagonospora nodorum]KAH5007237.1 hypothetical protein HBI75_220020 [Parastagonospora nodorum]KAH5284102.1 hypothetical protein HBI70_053570 [Parastagonospora nodorum]KAH5465297.1 hypothetical protein HBI28_230970 [Parastagonospora nodorum]